MQTKSAIMMRVLLNGFHQGSFESFLSCLPGTEAQEVLAQQIDSGDPLPALAQPLEKLTRIHYSWLVPLVEKLPADVREVMVKALPEPHQTKVAQALKLELKAEPLADLVQIYLVDELYQRLKGAPEVLPPDYLPRTAISGLTEWKKDELLDLIDLLGLHDLTEEIRQVVDKKKLQSIYSCLNKRELQYLQHNLLRKEKIATPSLGLDRWNGDCKKLKSVMHSRGLVRLGKALSGEHPDILWHIMHALDQGRGEALQKVYSKKPLPGVTGPLSQQVQGIINILKKKSDE